MRPQVIPLWKASSTVSAPVGLFPSVGPLMNPQVLRVCKTFITLCALEWLFLSVVHVVSLQSNSLFNWWNYVLLQITAPKLNLCRFGSTASWYHLIWCFFKQCFGDERTYCQMFSQIPANCSFGLGRTRIENIGSYSLPYFTSLQLAKQDWHLRYLISLLRSGYRLIYIPILPYLMNYCSDWIGNFYESSFRPPADK